MTQASDLFAVSASFSASSSDLSSYVSVGAVDEFGAEDGNGHVGLGWQLAYVVAESSSNGADGRVEFALVDGDGVCYDRVSRDLVATARRVGSDGASGNYVLEVKEGGVVKPRVDLMGAGRRGLQWKVGVPLLVGATGTTVVRLSLTKAV